MDTPREWLELAGPTVDAAVKAALAELGLESADQLEVEVIQENKKGVLGLGGREAIIKVTPLQQKRRRRRRRRRSGSGGDGDDAVAKDQRQEGGQRGKQQQKSSNQRGKQQGQRKSNGNGQQRQSNQRDRNRGKQKQDDRSDGRKSAEAAAATTSKGSSRNQNATKDEAMATADISEQATVAQEFLEGLLDAFGLEGTVSTRVDEDVLYLEVTGEQTEALVGTRGTIMTSVLEITRTVVQRKTFGAPRMRLDIAGYGERRRAALTIYAGKLADQVKEGGNEVMLEPMNPADRKVVHDAVGEIDGVSSFSEGEDPNRAVVIAPDDE